MNFFSLTHVINSLFFGCDYAAPTIFRNYAVSAEASVRAGAGPAGLRSAPPEFVRPGVRRTPRQSPAVGPAEAGPPRQ